MNDRLIFLVGLNTGFVSEGEPDGRYIDFYQSRSSKELHCAIVGNVVIPLGHGTNASTPMLSRAQIWTQLASEISNRGSIPGIQLATAWEGYQGSRGFRAKDSHKAIQQSVDIAHNISRVQLEQVLDSLDTAVDLAWWHGFRHIQVHAAHGYLLSLLVDQRISPHAEQVLSRLAALAHRCCAEGIETSIRISLRTGDMTFDCSGRERDDFHAAIAALPFDFVDVSSGFYNIDKQLIYPARPDSLTIRRRETISLAESFPGRRFIFSGRALESPTENLPENVHIGLCRDLIANPRYLAEPGNGCINSGKCHYFSRREKHITCPRWHETHGEPLASYRASTE